MIRRDKRQKKGAGRNNGQTKVAEVGAYYAEVTPVP